MVNQEHKQKQKTRNGNIIASSTHAEQILLWQDAKLTIIMESLIGRCNNSTRGIHQCILTAVPVCVCPCVWLTGSCLLDTMKNSIQKMLFCWQHKKLEEKSPLRDWQRSSNQDWNPFSVFVCVCTCLSVWLSVSLSVYLLLAIITFISLLLLDITLIHRCSSLPSPFRGRKDKLLVVSADAPDTLLLDL